MIRITTITGKSFKKYNKAASYNIKYMYKANKYSKMRLNYKGPFLKVMGYNTKPQFFPVEVQFSKITEQSH